MSTITKPLGNRIVAEVLEIPKTVGRLLLPDNIHLDKIIRGRVLSKGPKVGDKLQIDDIVVFDSKYGQRLKDNDNHRILDVGCLLAVESKVA